MSGSIGVDPDLLSKRDYEELLVASSSDGLPGFVVAFCSVNSPSKPFWPVRFSLVLISGPPVSRAAVLNNVPEDIFEMGPIIMLRLGILAYGNSVL